MCSPVSGITKSDGTIYMPDPTVWDHSHTAIAKRCGIPDGLFGDKYARWECTPEDGNFQSDPATWKFRLDEKRAPEWWNDDAPALEDSARQAVKRYLASCTPGLVPGSTASATGHSGTASVGTGYACRGKAAEQGIIVLAERDVNWNLLGWVVGVVGQGGIKANQWYIAKGGVLVECDDEITREADRKIAELSKAGGAA